MRRKDPKKTDISSKNGQNQNRLGMKELRPPPPEKRENFEKILAENNPIKKKLGRSSVCRKSEKQKYKGKTKGGQQKGKKRKSNIEVEEAD